MRKFSERVCGDPVTLKVGGKQLKTSTATLAIEPKLSEQLATYIQPQKELDRDPEAFSVMLRYLRNNRRLPARQGE